jgi:hypothetical protein
MWNGGVGVGGPMDWTLLPELTLRVTQGGYFVVTHYEGVGVSSQAGGESGGIGLNISF